MASWTGKKANVTYTKPEEPSFLKKFKEKVGYKEDNGLSDKFQKLPDATSEDLEDQDDELPQVVQLHPGDISQEEYKQILCKDEDISKLDEEKEECLTSDGKILFKKPTVSKRKMDMNTSTKKQSESKTTETKRLKKEEKFNKRMLSFDDDEEEEDEGS